MRTGLSNPHSMTRDTSERESQDRCSDRQSSLWNTDPQKTKYCRFFQSAFTCWKPKNTATIYPLSICLGVKTDATSMSLVSWQHFICHLDKCPPLLKMSLLWHLPGVQGRSEGEELWVSVAHSVFQWHFSLPRSGYRRGTMWEMTCSAILYKPLKSQRE